MVARQVGWLQSEVLGELADEMGAVEYPELVRVLVVLGSQKGE